MGFNSDNDDNVIDRRLRVRVMGFNTTFNAISVISWLSVLLVEETVVPGKNHQPATSYCLNLSHNASSTPCHERDFNL